MNRILKAIKCYDEVIIGSYFSYNSNTWLVSQPTSTRLAKMFQIIKIKSNQVYK